MNDSSEGIAQSTAVFHQRPASPAQTPLLVQFRAAAGANRAPDAAAFLADHPDLAGRKSIVLDLAYEEYCVRIENGERIDIRQFAEKFPRFRTSLRHLIEVHDFLAEHAASLGPPVARQWPEVGELFLGFQLVEELGRGAFSRVFFALEQSAGNRQVVVKIASETVCEAELLAKFQHANIVPVFSIRAADQGGLNAVCMPYLGCVTLQDVIDQMLADGNGKTSAAFVDALASSDRQLAPSPGPEQSLAEHYASLRGYSYPELVAWIGLHLARALCYTHGRGVAHGDLKPSNVLLASTGYPMLLDFNLASDGNSVVRLGGTLPYIAPEQIRGICNVESNESTPRGAQPWSDIFSLGVIMYEMITGKPPFPNGRVNLSEANSWEAVLAERERPPLAIQTQNQQADRRLSQIIDQCLAVHPGDRPAAAGLASLLEDYLSSRRRLQRKIARHPRLVGAVLAVSLATATGLGCWISTLPSAAVAEYRNGLLDFQHDQYPAAIRHLSRSLESDPKQLQGLVLRALARQRTHEFSLALQDYETAAALTDDPRILAGKAYCLAKLRSHKSAINGYTRAIELGYDTAAVENNLGVSLAKNGDVQAARTSFDRAIELAPRLQPAYHNRALLGLKRSRPGENADLRSAIADIDRALEIGPPSAELYFDAAVLHAIASTSQPASVELALRYAQQAIRYGKQLAEFENSSIFAQLKQTPGFSDLRTTRREFDLVPASYEIEPFDRPLESL